VPYLSALDVRSRQGAIQIHVYLYFTFTFTFCLRLLFPLPFIVSSHFRFLWSI